MVNMPTPKNTESNTNYKNESGTKMATKKIAKSHKTAQKYTGISPIMSTVNVSKPATILYKKLPNNMILITGFENFLTGEEIKEKYGKKVTDAYQRCPDSMLKRFSINNGDIFIVLADSSKFSAGDVLNKKEFSHLVQRIKKCGSLLHDIIAAVNDGQVKRITI